MSTNNVTDLPLPVRSARRRRPMKTGVRLAESDRMEGFCTHDVLNGLHGICQALDTGDHASDGDTVAELHSAALVLATILQNRVETD